MAHFNQIHLPGVIYKGLYKCLLCYNLEFKDHPYFRHHIYGIIVNFEKMVNKMDKYMVPKPHKP
jgi:hypothetical protein